MRRPTVIALLLTASALGIGFTALPDQQIQQPANIEVVADGFQVQHLYEVPLQEQGSWVSITVGPDGSLYASDQGQAGLYRIEVSGELDTPQVEVTKVPLDVTGFQGLEWAFGSLYANRNSTDRNLAGLYRMRDLNEDGELDSVEHMGIAVGGGEHGIHDILLTGDRQGLYFVAGNFSQFYEDRITRRTITNWQEDNLLGLQPDARGHARGLRPPGGFILRLDPDATDVTLLSIGYRNQYGAAVNQHGELFTYDADMEYDMGQPWYRPTRINHVVSGSEYGWRNGTGKWPEYFDDSLPSIVDLGPGSPTGVIMGTGARFPARYQNALYALDWTFSTIFAVHFTPSGSSYTAEYEEFIAGDANVENSLQVTDAVIGLDGHMYFLTGGRGTQGHLYRVVYRGNESTAPAPLQDTPEAAAARQLRHQLEAFHGRQDANAVNTAWPHLSSSDRFLRNAARVAIEWQPVDTWLQRAVAEQNSRARITAMIALARNGGAQHREAATRALLELPMAQLTPDEKLGMLRAFQLVFLRLGDPTDDERAQIVQALNGLLPDPGQDVRVNTELIRNLVYLRDPQVTPKAMALVRTLRPTQAPHYYDEARSRRSSRYGDIPLAIIANPPPVEAIGIAWILRQQREGWTEQLRRDYFEFVNYALEIEGGFSYAGHLADMRAEALRNTTPEHRAAVADLTGRSFVYRPDFPVTPPQGPGQEWTMQTALMAVQPRMTERDFEAGRNLFFAVGCADCHFVNQYGSDTGPDLTTLPDRNFNINRILEKLVRPDTIVEHQWRASEVSLADGRTVVGYLEYRDDRAIIQPRAHPQPVVEVPRTQVVSARRLDISPMPPGQINRLNEEELANLIAYLQSAGNPDAQMYAPRAAP